MEECNPDVLEVLKSELRFLENGGYRHCLLRPWRPQLAFIESRTCQKNAMGGPQNCDGCVLTSMISATPRSLLDALDGQREDRLHRGSAAINV